MGFASWQRYCTASSSGHQPNCGALNRGRHLCSAGRPSGWALAHILVLHKTALPPETDGSIVFARWRQCACIRGHIGATWRIRLNFCFLRPTRVHNSNGKSIGSAIFAQLTADTLQWVLRHPKLPIPMGHLESGRPSNTIPLAHPSTQPKRHIDRFNRFCRAH